MAPGPNRLSRGIAYCFFTDEEYIQWAFARPWNLRQSKANSTIKTDANQQQVNVIAHQKQFSEGKRMAPSNSQRIQKEEKFSGKIGENVSKSLPNYDEAYSNYGLTNERKLRYLRNVYDVEAKHFYHSYVQYTSDQYKIAAGKMLAKFNNGTSQNRVKSYLRSLILPKAVQKDIQDLSDALEKTSITIAR